MFELEDCVSYVATNASKDLIDGFDRKLKNHGITRVQWTALYYIGKYQQINQKQLSTLMRIKESSTTGLVDRMVKEGFIKKKLNHYNRREMLLFLTQKGEKLRSDSIHLGQEYSDFISQGIKLEDLSTFFMVLDKMKDNANMQE
ncbi:MarR family transcriptional regulator [Alkalibaculum sp. M08DMB]|uniref:MarR family transcriptional regulator n=1 Tax=Alkalibaculum sporogenes TaxID=2655001 RepID=A0A6A7K5C9_9FIRM|nr:MarR family transcriptional regulator [Alkalibaculum sporogenes]MPW24467.1 MarR family transcriptional regulator [Alkalibaculum sporogenes]